MSNQIQEIVNKLKHYDELYFNNSETDEVVDDLVYENLRNKLKILDPANVYLTGVGSDVRGGKVPLPFKMGSLNQVYNDNDIENWISKYSIKNVVITDKLDGSSCLLIYRNGKLSQAFSRGNGSEGADITRNVIFVKSLPKNISCDYLVVRAEVIIKTSLFDKKYSSEFKNSRNMVSGIMNRKVPSEDVLCDFDIISYEIVDGSIYSSSKMNELTYLSELGFLTPNYNIHLYASEELNDEKLSLIYQDRKKESDYLLDGLVITTETYKNIGSETNSSSLNPEHSVKYKNLTKDAYKQVSVVDVLWELSKSGYFKPRVKIVPTMLGGVTVTYATGFNGQFIKDNGIGPGAVVKIVRAGEVVPYIVETITTVEPKMPSDDYIWNESGVEIMVQDPENNSKVKFEKCLSFFETLKVDLLREASLQSVFDYYNLYSSSFEDAIVHIMEMIEPEWVKVIGVNGSKIYKSLHSKLQKLPPEEFLGALSFFGFGFGVRKSKMLLEQCDGIDNVKNLSQADIIAMTGFDETTANMILSGVDRVFNFLNRLQNLNLVKIVKKQQVSNDLSSMNVVLTGFRDSTLQNFIEMNGGKVASGVSKKTTHLICATLDSGSSKYMKAKELGVEIMTVDEFKEKFL
jgi:DNA ligase (NAD+)